MISSAGTTWNLEPHQNVFSPVIGFFVVALNRPVDELGKHDFRDPPRARAGVRRAHTGGTELRRPV